MDGRLHGAITGHSRLQVLMGVTMGHARRSRPWSVGPISSEARLDAIDAGLRVLQADIEAAFLSDALDHLGEAQL